jgi:hypothetical protein
MSARLILPPGGQAITGANGALPDKRVARWLVRLHHNMIQAIL